MMKKHSNPTEINSGENYQGTAPGSVGGGLGLRGSSSGHPVPYNPIVPNVDSQLRGYPAGATQGNQHMHYQTQPHAEPHQVSKTPIPSAEAPAANKTMVPSESSYPKPNKDQDLIKIFQSRPDLFEGRPLLI